MTGGRTRSASSSASSPSSRSPLTVLKKRLSSAFSVSPSRRASISATKVQAWWRGSRSRKRTRRESQQATKLQAHWRGRMSRMTAACRDSISSPKLSAEERMRALQAKVLFPGRDAKEREYALLPELERDLASKSPSGWAHVSAAPPPPSPLSLPAAATASDQAQVAKAATAIQAKVRGLLSRRTAPKAQQQPEGATAAGSPPQPASAPADSEQHLRWRSYLLPACAALAVAAASAMFIAYAPRLLLPLLPPLLRPIAAFSLVALPRLLYTLLYYTVMVALALWAWVRLPYWQGWLLTHVLTALPLHSYPIGFETIRLVPWLSFRPLTFHADIACSNFYMGNPTKIGCRDPHLVRVAACNILASCELGFLLTLLRGERLTEPIVFRFHHLLISGVAFNMMFGSTGEFNLVAMQKEMTENEMRAALGGECIHPYRSLTLPNIIKVRVIAARHLQSLPGLKPRVKVTMRDVKLSTGVGTKSYRAPSKAEKATRLLGTTVEYRFGEDGTELLIPVGYDQRDGVLIVRVYNDNVLPGRKPALLGQWFMTVKYLIMFPMYCKHSAITSHGDGAISGTFLLTDAKFRGSAMRSLGPYTLGKGYSGELDMAIHYTRSELLEPPFLWDLHSTEPKPQRKEKNALDQLNAYPMEDTCKFGNMAELKALLDGLPMRFDIELFQIRKVVIEMSDLFAGRKKEAKGHGGHLHTPFKAAKDAAKEAAVRIDTINLVFPREVTLYGLLSNLATQLVKNALQAQALYTAVGEVFSGLGENLGSQFGAMREFLPQLPWQSRRRASSTQQEEDEE